MARSNKKQGRAGPSGLHQGAGIVLILTRRIGEKVIIGENVKVTVLSVKGNQVRIGIDAPRDISVNREEVYERILKEQQGLNTNGWVKTPTPRSQAVIRVAKPTGRTLSLSDK